jgi:RNA polymerase sigma factor (TIGR02999 family)
MMAATDSVTQALIKAKAGDEAAAEELWTLVYEDLRRVAGHQLLGERPDHTFSPTALVHEAYLRLVDQTRVDWKSRAHFFAVASRMMRRILIDYARQHHAQKRGGANRQRTGLRDDLRVGGPAFAWLLDLDRALDQLGRYNERFCRVVECKYFGEMTEAEIAQALDVSSKTVQRDWIKAQVLLAEVLADDGGA